MRPRLRTADVLATVALVLALAGTATAARLLARDSVGHRQIKRAAVGAPEIASRTVGADKVRDATLQRIDLAVSPPAGPAGATGAAGAAGERGTAGATAGLGYTVHRVRLAGPRTVIGSGVDVPLVNANFTQMPGERAVALGAATVHSTSCTAAGENLTLSPRLDGDDFGTTSFSGNGTDHDVRLIVRSIPDVSVPTVRTLGLEASEDCAGNPTITSVRFDIVRLG